MELTYTAKLSQARLNMLTNFGSVPDNCLCIHRLGESAYLTRDDLLSFAQPSLRVSARQLPEDRGPFAIASRYR